VNTDNDLEDFAMTENTDTTPAATTGSAGGPSGPPAERRSRTTGEKPAEEGQPVQQEQTPETAPVAEEERPGRGNAEAAERRRELRAVQAERDALREHVASLQRAEVERLAGDTLAVPSDLWAVGGVDLADLLGPDGQLDPDAASAAIAALVITRPGLQKGAEVPAHLRAGFGYGYSGVRPGASADWGKVLRGQ